MPALDFVTRDKIETYCIACNTQSCPEGFVDTLREFHLTGTGVFEVYVCARCVWQMAGRVGCNDPGQVAASAARIAQLEQAVECLKSDLAAEQGSKVVSLADAKEIVWQNVEWRLATATTASAKTKPTAKKVASQSAEIQKIRDEAT